MTVVCSSQILRKAPVVHRLVSTTERQITAVAAAAAAGDGAWAGGGGGSRRLCAWRLKQLAARVQNCRLWIAEKSDVGGKPELSLQSCPGPVARCVVQIPAVAREDAVSSELLLHQASPPPPPYGSTCCFRSTAWRSWMSAPSAGLSAARQ
jgi:hypothetical protein